MASPNMLRRDARLCANIVPDGSRIFARQSNSSIARTSALEIYENQQPAGPKSRIRERYIASPNML